MRTAARRSGREPWGKTSLFTAALVVCCHLLCTGGEAAYRRRSRSPSTTEPACLAAGTCRIQWRHSSDASYRGPCVTPCDCPAAAPLCQHNIWLNTSQCVSSAPVYTPPLFFVHIPKTAGTSFRLGAARAFGSDHMCYDYGEKSPETGPIIFKYVYDERGRAAFQQAAAETCRMVAGHVSISKYVKEFGLRRTLAFVRRPLHRIVSEYHHHVRLNPSFRTPFMVWVLSGIAADGSRLVRGPTRDDEAALPTYMQYDRLGAGALPVEAIGFVGLTERYSESMDLLNKLFAIDIALMDVNAAPPTAEVASEMKEALKNATVMAAVRDELVMYARAARVHEERKRMAEACLPFAHGRVEGVVDGALTGWAWWAHSDDPVTVALYSNGAWIGRVAATQPHALAEWNAPRGGEVGWSFRLPAGLRTDAIVRVLVAGTRQVLGEWQMSQSLSLR